jgi:N-methylhydantoinase A
MVRALRARFAERGMDPRAFTMISMGGCGALFSAAIARELHMQRVLVPELASVLSAFGAATSDVRRERSKLVGRMIPADPVALRPTVDDLIETVRSDLAADGVPAELMSIRLGAELRFHRQKFELAMSWPGGIDEESQPLWPRSPRLRRSGGNRGDAGDRHRTHGPGAARPAANRGERGASGERPPTHPPRSA